jgi:hypothetical protein
MKNNLFKISSFNIYEKISNNFQSLKKVQKTAKTQKSAQEKKKENKTENQKPDRIGKKLDAR